MNINQANSEFHRPSQCPVEGWLTFLGHKWNALILKTLSDEPKRFSELAQHLPGISPKILTERLEALVAYQLVDKCYLASVPRGTMYELSPQGENLMPILIQLFEWATEPSHSKDKRNEQHSNITPS